MTMKGKIRIMLVEDNPEYRHVIEIALKRDPDMALVSKVGTAERALAILQDMSTHTPRTPPPDLLLLDLNLPGMSGLEAIPMFKKHAPKTDIIILTQSDREADVLCAISQGISGYLLKSATVKEIKDGIQTVMDGGSSLDPNVARFILDTAKTQLPKPAQGKTLSERELEILTLLAEGLVKKEIAARLSISNHTVVTHIRRIYEKLNATNAPSAVNKAYRMGIFPSPKSGD